MRGSMRSEALWLALGLWLAALGRVRGQEGGWHSLSTYVSSCTYTANETAAEAGLAARQYIQIAGTLNCGSACDRTDGQPGRDPDEESADYYNAYQMWTDHVNGLGGVRVGPAGTRYFVNITLCDDQGGLTSDRVEKMYQAFACGKDPGVLPNGIDFLLSPYGSDLT